MRQNNLELWQSESESLSYVANVVWTKLIFYMLKQMDFIKRGVFLASFPKVTQTFIFLFIYEVT